MTAYDASEWSDLFVATAGASPALAGLVFVAISINVERILKFEGLPERGLETVVLLVAALVVSVVGLIPGQGNVAFGLELLAVVAMLGTVLVRLPPIRPSGHGEPRGSLPARWAIRLSGALLITIGALGVLAEAGGGLYWVVAGMVFAMIGAVANAWVLLVEILR